MPYYKIDDQEALKWMKSMIANSFTRAENSSTPAPPHYPYLAIWHESLQHTIPLKDVAATAEPGALGNIMDLIMDQPAPKRRGRPPSAKTVAKKKAKAKAEAATDPYLCTEHPNRTGQRAPRDACAKCWDIYKSFHPNDWKNKWQVLQRKLKQDGI